METIPRMSFIDIIIKGFTKSFTCSGRSRRSEFWFFILPVWGIFYLLIFIFIKNIQNDQDQNEQQSESDKKDEEIFDIFFTIIMVTLVIIMIPSTSLMVRRLHDTGRSCRYLLCYFIPYAGVFILLFLCLLDSQKDENDYGPSPKYRRKKYSDIPPEHDYFQPIPPSVISPQVAIYKETTIKFYNSNNQENPQNPNQDLNPQPNYFLPPGENNQPLNNYNLPPPTESQN